MAKRRKLWVYPNIHTGVTNITCCPLVLLCCNREWHKQNEPNTCALNKIIGWGSPRPQEAVAYLVLSPATLAFPGLKNCFGIFCKKVEVKVFREKVELLESLQVMSAHHHLIACSICDLAYLSWSTDFKIMRFNLFAFRIFLTVCMG